MRALTVTPGTAGTARVDDLPDAVAGDGRLLDERLAVGICGTDREIDGYAAELWSVEPDYSVRLDDRLADVGRLMEPTTVVAEAWEQIVLENDVVVGSVNANLRHYRNAAEALAKADLGWLSRLITRRVPLDRFADALSAEDDDIKVVLTLTDAGR